MKLNYSLFLPVLASHVLDGVLAGNLNLTAISAKHGRSTLECWSLAEPPFIARGANNYPIGNFTGAFIGVLPPKTYIGQAWAPAYLYSMFLTGLVHITLPDSKDEAWIQGGKYGILIAADTKNVSETGHITNFPGGSDTVVAQFPITGNVLPAHKVLYSGPCKLDELIGM